jgi:hypothetical protein
VGSNVSDEAWAVQDGLGIPVSVGFSKFSGVPPPVSDVERGDIQRYLYVTASPDGTFLWFGFSLEKMVLLS